MGTKKSSGIGRLVARSRECRPPTLALHESLLHIFRENRGTGDTATQADTARAIEVERAQVFKLARGPR